MEKSKKKKIYKKIDMVSFYKSIVDQDRASVVICNLKHEIIYMNPVAVISYAKRGGDKLIGRSLLDCHNPESKDKIQQVVDWFAVDESHNIVYTFLQMSIGTITRKAKEVKSSKSIWKI